MNKIIGTLLILSLALIGTVTAINFDNWVGKPAPNFTLQSIPEGKTISLKDYKGKVILIDFWASWCGPCKRSLPELSKLESQYKNLTVLAINIDDQKKNAQEFMQRYGISLTTVFDKDKKVAETYALAAMPSALVIDKNGIVRYIKSGYTTKDMDDIIDAIESNL